MSPNFTHKFQSLPSYDEPEQELQSFDSHHPSKRKGLRFFIISLLVSSFFINLISMVFWIRCYRHGCSLYPQLTNTPALDAIAYNAVHFSEATDVLLYEQDPSPAVDAAWRSLYDFSGSSLPGYNRTPSFNESLEFVKQKGNKIQLLDVFHQLHCLDTIRQAFYSKYYTHPIDPNHVIHCINSVRQSLICMADVSDVSWIWDDRLGGLVENQDNFHTCRDFEKIKRWALEHHYDRQFVKAPQ